jgi:ribosomal-protein-alanine N-acetyltransferase
MQQTFKLRKFIPDDLQQVMQINRLCLPENYMDFFFMDLYQRFPETFIVAEESGKIVGYIMCRIEVGLASFGLGGLIRKGHVVSIAVLPQGRRKGVAQELMTKAMKGMCHYKAKLAYLEVRVTNDPGVALYRKLGFEVSRTLHGYYSDGEDAFVMTRKL